jgi:hypothetical protein
MPPNLLLVLVALFGFTLHALSTDGGGSVLARIGITTWAIPKAIIPPMILVVGLGDAIFQGVQHGLSWGDAATQGFIASLTTLAGVVGSQHLTGRDAEGHSMDVTPPKGLLVFVGAGILAVYVGACSLFTPANLPKTELAAETVACVIEHAFLDDPSLNAVCNLLTADQQAAAKKVRAAHRAALSKQMRTEHCAPDAGAEAGE